MQIVARRTTQLALHHDQTSNTMLSSRQLSKENMKVSGGSRRVKVRIPNSVEYIEPLQDNENKAEQPFIWKKRSLSTREMHTRNDSANVSFFEESSPEAKRSNNPDTARQTLEGVIDSNLPTENITLISHAHGRQRRVERRIQRKELQAAIKYGIKEAANPGRDGSIRLRYTYNGVVYITDETSRHEVTSWRLDGKDDEKVAPAQVSLGGSGCHAVLIIDHSGSMRKSDVPGYNSRAHAVYECLKRDFVKDQLKSGASDDVVVTLISMSDTPSVLFHKHAFDETLIDKLDRASEQRPRSHGNYIPALDKALEVMKVDASNRSSLLLLFFSDGAPSDGQGKKVNEDCCQRVKSIGQVFGRDKVIFCSIAFGPPGANFSLMKQMADVLPRGSFQSLALNAANLKTSFSSLSRSLHTLRAEKPLGLTLRSDKVVDVNQRVENALFLAGTRRWRIYAFFDFFGKYEYTGHQCSAKPSPGSNGFAFHRDPFAEGAERFVYRCSEIFAKASDYTGAASRGNIAKIIGLRLVAKEAKDVENHEKGFRFHETFARIQKKSRRLAKSFTASLPSRRMEWNIAFLRTSIYGYYDDDYKNREAWILVEPELDGKFMKWNNNGGEVRRRSNTQIISDELESMALMEEEEDDQEDMDPVAIDDIPQTFSHFSYECTGGKQLVCDLQGVWNANDGFVLTDPVIHHVSANRRAHINGATDKGLDGVKKFFDTHVCNSLCKKMGLQPRTRSNLLRA